MRKSRPIDKGGRPIGYIWVKNTFQFYCLFTVCGYDIFDVRDSPIVDDKNL